MNPSKSWIGAGTLSMLVTFSQARAQDAPDAGALPAQAEATPPASSTPRTTPCEAERFVVLSMREGLEPALFDEVRTDLAAELAHRGIAVCADAITREPAASISLSADASTVVIELDDRVTHKRVGRDLALNSIPANGRALAIAIAIDELLRASWAELTLRRGTEAAAESEPATSDYRSTRTMNARGPAEMPLRFALGGEFGFAHASERFDAFSLSARATLRAWERGWFALSVGGLTSLPVSSQLGDVLASGLRVALTGGVCGRDRRRAFGCAGLRGEFDYLSLRGFSPQAARGRSELAPVVHLAAVGGLGVTLQSGRTLFAELSVGGVLQGAEATDGMRVIVGVTGLMLGLHIGLDFEL